MRVVGGFGPTGDRDLPTGDSHDYATWDAAYVLGSLSPTDRREFEAHLSVCPSCSQSVGELSGIPALLSKLDSTDPAPNTIWIFTANDTERLERRFLSRCKVLEFSSYGLAGEITSYLDRVWHTEGGNGNAPDLARLVKESRNNVRDCLMCLEVELMAL